MSTARTVRSIALAAAVGTVLGLAIERLTNPGSESDSRWIVALVSALAAALVCAIDGLFLPAFLRRGESGANGARNEAAERESAKYRSWWDGAADMVLVIDAKTRVVLEQNARAREECAAVSDLTQLLSDEDVELFQGAIARAIGAVRGESGIPSVRIRTPSGRELDCEARLAMIVVEGTRVVHIALRDRTHERAAENELAVRERLSSLGLLTAGVAHEINNPLEGIGNHLKLLTRPDLTPEDRARHLGLVRHGFERIRDIVRDLLRFARPSKGEGDVDLVQVVDRARRMAAYSDSFRSVEFAAVGFERPFLVLGDAGRLEQVVLNLFLNAAHAMSGRGRIVVTAHRSDRDARFVAISIADDGPGIPPEHLEHVFDPFFTTGGGTGLGLSIAYGILEAHGGTLAVRNRPEGGAEFTLRFPAASSKSSEEAA